MDEKVTVSFDKDYKLRIFDSGKYDQAEELDKECGTFMESKSFYISFS